MHSLFHLTVFPGKERNEKVACHESRVTRPYLGRAEAYSVFRRVRLESVESRLPGLPLCVADTAPRESSEGEDWKKNLEPTRVC